MDMLTPPLYIFIVTQHMEFKRRKRENEKKERKSMSLSIRNQISKLNLFPLIQLLSIITEEAKVCVMLYSYVVTYQ